MGGGGPPYKIQIGGGGYPMQCSFQGNRYVGGEPHTKFIFYMEGEGVHIVGGGGSCTTPLATVYPIVLGRIDSVNSTVTVKEFNIYNIYKSYAPIFFIVYLNLFSFK